VSRRVASDARLAQATARKLGVDSGTRPRQGSPTCVYANVDEFGRWEAEGPSVWEACMGPEGRTTLPIVGTGGGPGAGGTSGDGAPVRWAKIIDQTRCIGCHACTTACKSENEVPLGVTRTYVKNVDVGVFPEARRNYQVTRCNQCADAPCATACPTSAMFVREDGIVDFDKESCIGCKACIAACPYDAIFINPEDHSAEKCNFCAHRIDVGLEPACSVVCPVEAILVGDLNDPGSKVAQTVNREAVQVRRPEKDTKPKLFYRGAHQSTLDPLAAARPAGDVFAWAQQAPEDGHHINSGTPPGQSSSSAAAVLSYDIGHDVPWDWRVGLYTWTKSIAAGLYLVVAGLLLSGLLAAESFAWRWGAPLGSLAFLGITGAVLVWDLEHPSRFFYIFTRPQWRSWLVRGGVIITAYGAVLSVHVLGSLLDATSFQRWLTILGLPLATMTAVYTAFLFAQAKARDLWQNPLLPPHFAVQAGLSGTAALLLFSELLDDAAIDALVWVLVATSVAHLLMILGEITLPHGTAHARLAVHELTGGRFATPFRAGVGLALLAVPLAFVLPWAAGIAALAGLLAYEHAYVQAGQSVPLA
jgi:Fe-S-cluster-containing dehydrogenase component/formate-dependent nitrite reductase membrane component NrfD